MKLRIRKLMAFALFICTIALFPFGAEAFARGNCKSAKGSLFVVNNGNGTTSGVVTQSRFLNGTTAATFTSSFTPTPDPATFSFTDDLTISTGQGMLTTHNVGIFDTANGLFSAINRIDPAASTGIFAGATGALFVSGNTSDGGATFHANISGEICTAD